MSTLGWIIVIVIAYFLLAIPFTALFKIIDERCYRPGNHIVAGLFWPVALALNIFGQLLLSVGTALCNFYDWSYNWLNKHIK